MLGQTPMMKQYQEIKKQYPDAILFFRLGDFYEMFGSDALLASRELDITLTGRDAGMKERVPMCGVPYHAADNYLAKLIKKGYKVAICEQIEDPKVSKGIVKREVIRVVTPGTTLDTQIIQEATNLYLAALSRQRQNFGLAFCDVSTGEFWLSEFSGSEGWKVLQDELFRLQPTEILLPANKESEFAKILSYLENTLITPYTEDAFSFSKGRQALCNHFQVASLEVFACQNKRQAVASAGAILQYLLETQKSTPQQVKKLQIYYPEKYLALDATTFRNLELTKTLRSNEPKGSLLDLLDKTKTACGARLLRHWLQNPLTNKKILEERLDAVEILSQNWSERQKIRRYLEAVYDLERLMTRILYERANPQELLSLKTSLTILPELKAYLTEFKRSSYLTTLQNNLDLLEDVVSALDLALEEKPPFNLKEGGVIKKGYHQEIDKLREASEKGKEWIACLEGKEKENTGIKSLKIGYNKIFGYYFEVTKANLSLVPDYFQRKQTLANSERYITDELQQLANQVLGAEEKLIPLEEEIYKHLLKELGQEAQRVQQTSQVLAQIDVLQSLAEVAVQNSYVRPQLLEQEENYLHFVDLRHPVVEKVLPEAAYVPNDLSMSDEVDFYIITGPNMGGKSTYCRSVALAVIMAQMGSFVPAKEAVISLRDRVFARVGASDDLRSGQSTFMVEMNEVANILNHATPYSLVVLDEVGRGTSTCDGLSMAWAISEYLIKELKSKTLFATHYHELTCLSNIYEGIKNLSVAVQEKGEEIVFLHKIIPGATDKSYGIQVAKLAGLPQVVVDRANEILKNLEAEKENENNKTLNISQATFAQQEEQNSNLAFQTEQQLYEKISSWDLLSMTPLEALNELYQLQQQLKK
ncbi:MAG: DNA mismatch repair protein MutS [Clostridia bacterium]|nr:DNA mismatch repair protein MutS [Clostridia bacterium]